MRVFIAAEIPEDIRKSLSHLLSELKNTRAEVKWVRAQNLHLTLKFLGSIEKKWIHAIIKTLQGDLENRTEFPVSLEGFGVFPNKSAPKILWTGIQKGQKEICELAAVVDKHLLSLGFKKEKRPFHPHLTLGRIKSAHSLKQAYAILSTQTVRETFLLNRISLIQSELEPTGAVYTPIHHFELKGISNGRQSY